MGLDQELQKSLAVLVKKDAVIFPGEVKSVDEASGTIEIEDKSGFPYKDVRLKASIDGNENAVLVIPKTGSSVLVAQIGNTDDSLFVVSVSEVEKITGKIQDTGFEINADGYKLEKGSENLLQILSDMIDELNKIVVIQGNTIDVVAMNQIKQRLNSILK